MRYNRTMLAENRLRGIIHNAVRRVLREGDDSGWGFDNYGDNYDYGDSSKPTDNELWKQKLSAKRADVLANIKKLTDLCEKLKVAYENYDGRTIGDYVGDLKPLAQSIEDDSKKYIDLAWEPFLK